MTGVGVEKGLFGSGCLWGVSTAGGRVSSEDWKLSRCEERRSWTLAEEADQSLNVLCSRRQEELLANKLQSPQAQATQSGVVLDAAGNIYGITVSGVGTAVTLTA